MMVPVLVQLCFTRESGPIIKWDARIEEILVSKFILSEISSHLMIGPLALVKHNCTSTGTIIKWDRHLMVSAPALVKHNCTSPCAAIKWKSTQSLPCRLLCGQRV